MISLSVPGAGQLRLVVSRCVRYWRVNQKLVWPLVLVYYTVTVVHDAMYYCYLGVNQ